MTGCLMVKLIERNKIMKLRDASLCCNCDELYVRRKSQEGCPACADRASVKLTNLIKPLNNLKEEYNGQHLGRTIKLEALVTKG